MIHTNLLDIIGNTPLLRLNFDTPATVYAKLEYLNPGGSIKDRAALYMIEKAERLGLLKPGGTIIEASSGNQGISAALIGAVKGYKVIIVASEKVSKEKLNTLRAYGAELILCPPTSCLTDKASYHAQALELYKNTPNSFMLNQYFNPDNAEAHYTLTGPELYKQLEGKITHFCSGLGSGGTVSGIARYLKEQNREITVIGVDAACSYRATNKNPQPYQLDGMGVDYDSPLVDESVLDTVVTVSDAQGHAMLKELARMHGLLVGPASGAIAYAAREYARKLTKNDTLVLLFTDSGRAYLTKNYYYSDSDSTDQSAYMPSVKIIEKSLLA